MVGRRGGYTRITGLREILRTVLFTSRFLSDFSSEHIFRRRCHRFINHCPLGARSPPVTTGPPPAKNPLISFPPFFNDYAGYTHEPQDAPLEGKTFSPGRWVTIHHATDVLFATRAQNIFIRSHTLPSSPSPLFVFTLLVVLLFA
uniref:Uncharacterized protein n=1 Tax=Schizaphis graminum TaxID=13262 RepID=A0A2S2NRP5_SCHGA